MEVPEMNDKLAKWILGSVIVLGLMFLILFGETGEASGNVEPTRKVAETNLEIPYEKVKEVFSTYLGTPTQDGEEMSIWHISRYRILVGKLDTDTDLTYLALRVRYVKKREVVKLSKLSSIREL
jgi:hypothetical protein